MDDDRFTLVRWGIVRDGPDFYVMERQPGSRETTQWGPCESEDQANALITERRAMFEQMVKDKISALSAAPETGLTEHLWKFAAKTIVQS